MTLLIGTIGVLFLGVITSTIHKELYDPLWLRILLSIPSILVLVLSYKVAIIKRNFVPIWFIGCFLFSAWIFFLVYKNNMEPQYLLGLLGVFIGASLGFEDRQYFRVFILSYLAIVFIVVYSIKNTTVNKDTFLIQFLVIAIFNYLVIDNYIRSKKKLGEVNYYLETLFEGSGLASILLNDKGEILDFNNKARVFTEKYLNQNLKSGTSFFKIIPENEKSKLKKGLSIAYNGTEVGKISKVIFDSGEVLWLEFNYLPISYNGQKSVIFNFINVTHYKEIEHGLLDQNVFIKQLVENAPFEIYVFNLKTDKITWINNNLFHKLGYQKSGSNRNDILAICHPDDRPLFMSGGEARKGSGNIEPSEIEYRLKNISGEWVWVQSTRAILKKSDKGEIIEILVFSQDITKRKKQELQFARLSLVASNTNNSVMFTSKEGLIEWVNEGFTQITGYVPEEVKGKKPSSILQGPETDQRTKEKIKDLIAKEEKCIATILNYRKNGTRFWNELNILPIKNNDNETEGYFSIQSDVTERMVMWENIRKSEYELRSLFEKSPIGMVITDLKGNITQSNKAFSELLGYSEEELLDINVLELLHIDDQEESSRQDYALIKGKISCLKMERRYIHKKRYVIHVLIHVVLLRDHDNKPEAFFGQLLDITALKNTQRLIGKKNKELEKTNKELDNLVYSAAHDLRAPLTSVLGLVDLSEKEEDNEVLKTHINMMGTSIRKLDGFIIDIVNYSKNSRAGIYVEKIPFQKIVDDIYKQFAFIEGAGKIEKSFEMKSEIPFYSDLFRINVAFHNLIGNAIRYHDLKISDPFIKVSIITSNQEAIVKIIDNGPGIAVEFQERIFEMFFRASNKSKGTGLGLYIVKEAVRKIGGKITLSSTVGKGSTFEMILPNKYFLREISG